MQDRRQIIPDYRRPDALLVPHYRCDIQALLEDIAVAASRHIGVILLSRDMELSESFVNRQENSDHFSIISVDYDIFWLRD